MSRSIEQYEFEGLQAQTGPLANLLRMRDRAVGIHSERMRVLAREVCERMGLSPGDTRVIEMAAHLHDLGTIAIPDPILHKPGALDEEERRIMEAHAQLGYEALEATEEFAHVADIVLHHHERYDGTGYPDGLAGDDIPFGARVIAVLDSYDAMVSDRPYRPAKTEREAAEELIMGKGKQFDPEVVDAALRAIRFSVH